MKTGKFTFIMIIVLLFTSAACVFAAYRSETDEKEKKAEALCRVISSEIYSRIENRINEPVNIALTMANTTFLSDLLENESRLSDSEMTDAMTGYLSSLKEKLNINTAFVISECSKKYFTYEGLNKVINPEKNEHDIWYNTFVNGRKKYDTDIDSDEVNNNQWTVFVNARIENSEGKLLGVCGAGVNINDLHDILSSYYSSYGTDIHMKDSDGTVMISTSSVSIDSAVLTDTPYANQYDSHILKNESGDYEMLMFSPDLNLYITVTQPVGISAKEYAEKTVVPAAALIVNCVVFAAGITILRKKSSKEN